MQHHILFITAQQQVMAPIVAVLKTILGHTSVLVSPDDAVQTITEQPQDIIIIDMQGQTTPMALIQTLKRKFPSIPIIVMVPYGDLSMVEKIIAQGADDYISQPIALERLKVTLRNMLRLRGLLQRLAAGQADIDKQTVTEATLSKALFVAPSGKLHSLRALEDMAIHHAIEHYGGSMTRAAKALGIGRSTLYRKIQEQRPVMAHIPRENHTTRPMMADLSKAIS